jgi:hypothetical protein
MPIARIIWFAHLSPRSQEFRFPALQNFTCPTSPGSNQPLLWQATCKETGVILMMPFLTLLVLVQFFAASHPLKSWHANGERLARLFALLTHHGFFNARFVSACLIASALSRAAK